MFVDATFNTNELRLPLLVFSGITATGTTFPIAFAFITAESKEAFKWCFKCLDRLIFCDGCSPPRVVSSDQAAGIIAFWAERERN